MGLDQYAYVAMKAGADADYYSDENYDKDDDDPTKVSPHVRLHTGASILIFTDGWNIYGWKKIPGHMNKQVLTALS